MGSLIAAAVLAGPAAAAPKSTDPAQVPAGDYVLDKRHTSLVARVSHLGFSRYTLRFNGLDGGFTYDPANWAATKAVIRVDARSVDTGTPAFSRQVAQMFEPEKFPQITFTTREITDVSGATGKLVGDLSLHGITRRVALDVKFNGVGPGVLGKGTRLGFSGSGRINRNDFKVDAVRGLVGDEVELLIEAEFEKQQQ